MSTVELICSLHCLFKAGVLDLVSKWVRLDPSVKNTTIFCAHFITFWLAESKCAEIRTEKVPDLGTHLETKYDMTGLKLAHYLARVGLPLAIQSLLRQKKMSFTKTPIPGSRYGKVWLQIGSDWPQMRQIRDFFRSNFSAFGAPAPSLFPHIKGTAGHRPCFQLRNLWTV